MILVSGDTGEGFKRWQGNTEEKVEANRDDLNDHENRITKLERFKQRAYGAIAVISLVLGSFGVTQIIRFFTG